MKKIKSIVAVIMVITATVFGLTSCHHNGKHDGKCGKEMCCSKDCCDKCDGKECCDGKDCKEKCEKMCKEGKCCMKDSMGGMHGMHGMHDSMGAMKDGKECCKKGSKGEAGMYHCPMCKDVSSDKPGKCPKCGMEMEKTK